jgi:hypothetical protein
MTTGSNTLATYSGDYWPQLLLRVDGDSLTSYTGQPGNIYGTINEAAYNGIT